MDRTTCVAAQAAVAINVTGFRRYHERRVRDDQIELQPADGLEEVALPALDVLQVVQPGIERGQPHGPRIAVHGQHPRAVPGGKEGLETATGAEVERQGRGPPNRDIGQGQGAAADPHDVVRGQPCSDLLGPVVSQHEALKGNQLHGGNDRLPSRFQEPQPDPVLQLHRRDGLLRRTNIDRRSR